MNQQQPPRVEAETYELALRIAGVCEPGKEREFFARIPSLMRHITVEKEKALTKLGRINNCIGNPDKKYNNFEAVILGAYINHKKANRATITYAAYSPKAQGWVEDTIDTVPTNNNNEDSQEALEVLNTALALKGRVARIFKMPDWTANKPAKDGKTYIPNVAFYLEDMGEPSPKQLEEMRSAGIKFSAADKAYPTPADRHAPPAGAPVGDSNFQPQNQAPVAQNQGQGNQAVGGGQFTPGANPSQQGNQPQNQAPVAQNQGQAPAQGAPAPQPNQPTEQTYPAEQAPRMLMDKLRTSYPQFTQNENDFNHIKTAARNGWNNIGAPETGDVPASALNAAYQHAAAELNSLLAQNNTQPQN